MWAPGCAVPPSEAKGAMNLRGEPLVPRRRLISCPLPLLPRRTGAWTASRLCEPAVHPTPQSPAWRAQLTKSFSSVGAAGSSPFIFDDSPPSRASGSAGSSKTENPLLRSTTPTQEIVPSHPDRGRAPATATDVGESSFVSKFGQEWPGNALVFGHIAILHLIAPVSESALGRGGSGGVILRAVLPPCEPLSTVPMELKHALIERKIGEDADPLKGCPGIPYKGLIANFRVSTIPQASSVSASGGHVTSPLVRSAPDRIRAPWKG